MAYFNTHANYLTGRGFGEAPSCAPSTNCSAIAVDRFEKQPPDLRKVLVKSFRDPATWFGNLDPQSRGAVTSIFNRLCSYRLWCHVSQILKVVPGEAPLRAAGHTFNVPGSTPSVYFLSPSSGTLHKELMASGRFCMAKGIGASQHPGQTTLREISKSDSLHISIGPGNQFDAHIDKFSPVPGPQGSSFCSNDPTPDALRHIGREVVPGPVRKLTRIPGVQVGPDFEQTPHVPRPAPSTRQEAELQPPIIGVTVHGPVPRPRTRRAQASPLLPVDVVTRIDRAMKEQVSPEALLPSHVRVRLKKARWAAETAGPSEEVALRKARDIAEGEARSYPDPHELALDLAERMEQARRKRLTWVKIDLPQYGGGDSGSRKFVAGEIRRIALILRNHLPDRAKDVRTIVIFFGTGNVATREEVKLP